MPFSPSELGMLTCSPRILAGTVHALHRSIASKLRLDPAQVPCWLPPEAYLASAHVDMRYTPHYIASPAASTPPPIRHICAESPESSAWARRAVATLAQVGGPEDRCGASQLTRNGPELRRRVRRVQQAISALRRIWPEVAVELRLLIRVIAYLDDWNFSSCSSLTSFGCIYVGPPATESKAAAFEAVVHEVSHHALYLRQTQVPFLENPEALSSHPLRPDPRPLDGVLHAAFVLARIERAWELARSSGTNDFSNQEMESRLSITQSDLELTRGSLRQAAQFTSHGRALAQSLGV